MYNEKIEQLIKSALADGVLTEKEKQVLFKNAQAAGIDLDEFEMVLDARLVELQKAEEENVDLIAMPELVRFAENEDFSSTEVDNYIRNQLQEDKLSDQMSMKEFIDPFTGEKIK